MMGNPPGKKDSLGDQINWEVLLEHVPKDTELHIVAVDGDYRSALDDKRAHEYLAADWKKENGGQLCVHKELRPFLNDRFANIKLAVDIEKQSAIEALKFSGSFYQTHDAIATLKPYRESITWEEAKEIFEAAVSNSQISWIGTDEDVNTFIRELESRFSDKIDFGTLADLEERFPDRAKMIDDFEKMLG